MDKIRNEFTPEVGITLLVLSLIFLISFLVMIWLYFWERLNRIDPKLCPSIEGRYGVRPGLTSNPIGKVIPVESLSDAIRVCDQSGSCSGFSYSPTDRKMWFIDPNGLFRAGNSDLYLRQT